MHLQPHTYVYVYAIRRHVHVCVRLPVPHSLGARPEGASRQWLCIQFTCNGEGRIHQAVYIKLNTPAYNKQNAMPGAGRHPPLARHRIKRPKRYFLFYFSGGTR